MPDRPATLVGAQPHHLHSVAEDLDPIEALRRALAAAVAAPDLRGAFGAIAGWLAPAVGAKAALIVAVAPGSQDGEAPLDALIRRLPALQDAHLPAADTSSGALLVVVPSAGANDESQITSIVQAFAELAELCLCHAQRLHHSEARWTASR